MQFYGYAFNCLNKKEQNKKKMKKVLAFSQKLLYNLIVVSDTVNGS